MWSTSQGMGGGFMNTTASPGGPQGSGGSAGGKSKRAQNIVPVLIQEVLNAPEEGFTIEGTEVGLVKVVGKVVGVEKTATKTSYQIEDSTGSIDAIQWVEEGSAEKEHYEGTYIRVIGSIRTQGEKKHIMAFRIMEVPTPEERDFHALEVAYSHLKLKQMNSKMSGGEMDHSGLSNSMMGGGLGGTNFGGASTMSSSASFGNKNYDTVYNLIRQSKDDNGINIGSLLNEVKGKMSKQEVDSAIDFLSSEGHIYSTVDDEHFKTTDAD